MDKYTVTVENKTFDSERALYGLHNARVINCAFEGAADGESAMKEGGGLYVRDCRFALRYPFWHVTDADIAECEMYDTCRAAIWYCDNITVKNSRLHGVKALRECDNAVITGCDVLSQEFGWMNRGVKISNSTLVSEYAFLHTSRLEADKLELQGKYSFQYVTDAKIRDSRLDTKDAFWHSKNVTVTDSVINGEYLGWYSENLRLVNCTIKGTQPLCYARGLVMENCRMEDADLAFENSDVRADITGGIISVKNPHIGYIKADRIGEIILDGNGKPNADCEITERKSGKVTHT